MSKKSRKRNKKILAALALAGGAAMLGRGKGAVTGVVNPNLQKTIAADAGADIAEAVVPRKSYLSRMSGVAPDGGYVGQDKRANLSKIVSGVDHPILTQARTPPGTMRRFKGGGIAKRGTGAAYKSGGRVKSMGIAKRGGGVAKR